MMFIVTLLSTAFRKEESLDEICARVAKACEEINDKNRNRNVGKQAID